MSASDPITCKASVFGARAAIVNGFYALVEIPDPMLGPRKVDVETMYNKERLRPNYSNKVGLPIFLTRT